MSTHTTSHTARQAQTALAPVTLGTTELEPAGQRKPGTRRRTQAQPPLRQDADCFRPFVEHAFEIISTLDAEGRIRYTSPSVERLLGYMPEELVGESAFDYVHPEDLATVLDAFLLAVRSPGEAIQVEFHFRHKAGEWRSLEAIGSNLLDDPRVGGIVVNLRDVTRRNEIEAALSESEERYRRLVELSPEPTAVHRDGRFIYINPAGARLLGAAAADEILGKPILDFVHPQFREIVRARAHRSGNGQLVPTIEETLLRLDGEPFEAEVTGIPITYLGRPATQVVLHDITNRKRAEEEIRRQAARAEALVQIAARLNDNLELESLLEAVCLQVARALRSPAAFIALVDSRRQIAYTAADFGLPTAVRQRQQPIALADYRRLFKHTEARVEIASREHAHALLPQAEDSGTLPIRVAASVALARNGELIGSLHLVSMGEVQRFTTDEISLLQGMADQAALALDNAALFAGLQRSNEELFLAYETTLEGWSAALDLRDRETEGHTRRVTEMTVRLARELGFSDSELVHVRRGALLHDIGKMGIPDSILLKPGTLDEGEWEIMRRHPTYAYEMLFPIAYLRPALDIPYCHHEKWDGTGYPRGLKREAIPLAARVFAVVDVWDALRSDRPYRPAWGEERVREHVGALSGTHFEPRIVDVFLRDIAPPPG